MKKRILLVVIALVLVTMLLTLTACDNYADTLHKINTLLDADYAEVNVNVTTKTAGDYTLNGIYKLTIEQDITTIEYSYNRFNELSWEGNADTYLETVSGTAVVQDGVVIEGDASEALPQVDFNGISFKQAFFTNYRATGNKFDADVTNKRGFLGNSDFACTNMHVTVTFTTRSVTKLVITYVSDNGSEVNVTYLFTLR